MTDVTRWLSKPTLSGDLVTLRPFVRDDAIAIARILAESEVLRLTASVTSSEESLSRSSEPDDETFEWYGSRAETDERLDLAVIDNASGELVGEVVLNEYDAGANSCNFRTLLGQAGRGRGLGTEATRMILEYGFGHLGIRRVTLDVLATNPRARRVYEKVGFVVEGVSREAVPFDDGYIDDVWMAVLASDWAVHRGRPVLPSAE